MRSLATTQCSVVVYVRYLVAHIRTIVLLPFHSLPINQSLMLCLNTTHAPRITRLIPFYSLLLMSFLYIPIGQALVGCCLPLEKGIDIVFESWILVDELVQ